VVLVYFCALSGCGDDSAAPRQDSPAPALDRVRATRPAEEPSGPALFADVTKASGIDFTPRNGEEANLYTILESLGCGVGLLDYDRDGRLDVFLTGGGYFENEEVKGLPNRLYHNDGDWRFHDVTASVGLDVPLFYGHGCIVADYDADGWPDLLVTGYGRLALYRNSSGSRFEETTETAGLAVDKPDLHWSTSAAWADLNGDGLLDLFVGHYVDWSSTENKPCHGDGPGAPRDVCPPFEFEPLTQQLFLAAGDGTFREVSESAGIRLGKALGALAVDVNDDALPDVYVTNDALDNHLYLNEGEGRLREVGLSVGVALGEMAEVEGSMGVDAADLDGDGWFSLFVANYQGQQHAFYRNRGDGLFDHASSRATIAAIGRNFVGWGVCFVDFDLDGDEDLVIANGHVMRHSPPPQSLAQRAVLFENLGRRDPARGVFQFRDVGRSGGEYFEQLHRGRGVAVGDLDDDGRPDMVVSHVNEPVALLRNQIRNHHHWLGIELQGDRPRDPIGARLVLHIAGRNLVRTIKSGAGYLSTSDRRIVFGLGGNTEVERLTVRWPSGSSQSWEGNTLPVDRYVRLAEGRPLPLTDQP